MTIKAQRISAGIWKTLINCLMALGWLTLPLSHFRWLPNLGTTRPLCVFFFGAGILLLFLHDLTVRGLHARTLFGWDFLHSRLMNQPGWSFLRWWLLLCGLGVISTAITPLYGNLPQALNRLLGYVIILVYLYSALFSLEQVGIAKIAFWINLGYLPVLAYALFEALTKFRVTWAVTAVAWVRQWVIVSFDPGGRMAWWATEPSFVAFQVILLLAVLPFVQQRWLRATSVTLILLAVLFTQSGMVWMLMGGYLLGLGFFSFATRQRQWLIVSGIGAAGVLILGYWLSPALQNRLSQGWLWLTTQYERLSNMSLSAWIRLNYIFSLFFAMLETYGLGLGMGQYGQFWKDIYRRHIPYQAFDRTGEVAAALASDIYMRPWSVLLGVGVDLGLIGLALLGAFLWQIWRYCRTAHARAILLASLLGLAGAYPIVTPHLWLALTLLGGVGARVAQAKSR